MTFTPLFQSAAIPAQAFAPAFAGAETPFAPGLPAPPDTSPPPPVPEDLIAQARAQAAELLNTAQAEAARMVEREVQAAREAEIAAFEEVAAELLQSLHEEMAAHRDLIERQTAGLVVQIAERVLKERFEADEEAILPVVREALQPLADSATVRVIVAPRHEAALRRAQAELSRVLGEQAHLEIVVREEAEPFGCAVHGDTGSIDARLSTRLESLTQAAETVLAGEQAA